MHQYIKEDSSFRDPSGFVFYKDSKVYRAINESYKENYIFFISSGLKDKLIEGNLLIPFDEEAGTEDMPETVFKIIKPQKIQTIFYPYEWCFSQLKDAAIATLKIQKTALEYGMVLKDASAFNIQFWQGKPVLIDITSFEKYIDGAPWNAYKQFCQHFLSPLLLMKHKSVDINQLQKLFIDGIPVELASKWLPLKTHFSLSVLSHIHWHAKSQKHYQKMNKEVKHFTISKKNLLVFIDNINTLLNSIALNNIETEWGNYYSETNYSENAIENKKEIVSNLVQGINLSKVVDFGANDGTFSRIFSKRKIETIALDIDPFAVEKNYLKIKLENDGFLMPIVGDIANPSPAIGWENKERKPLLSRLNCDLALSLALIHHLTITHNLSFSQIAEFFAGLCRYLIIEFIPLDDSQIKKMILNRSDSFEIYSVDNFEKSFKLYFNELRKGNIQGSKRSLYFFEKLES